jgi:hypothetical protein
VAGTKAEVDLSNRFQAQQNARLALDTLRREIHCADSVSPTTIPPAASSISITLGAFCPTNTSGGTATVTWCTQRILANGTPSASSTINRWGLWRYFPGPTGGAVNCGLSGGGTGGSKKADYLTSANAFTAYNPSGSGVRATLGIDLPVDVNPSSAVGRYELQDNIVLRNSSR